MENIRDIVSKNLTELRKENNLTQLDLAKKINYSDKAISRWEKGEVLPDLETLQTLSEVFEVPISRIIENQVEEKKIEPQKNAKQLALSQIFIICEIWTILSVMFAYIHITKGQVIWQIFVWGVPATALILFVLNHKKNNVINFVYSTILVWSTITCIFLHMLDLLPWYIFLLGVPMQGMLIVRYIFNFKQHILKSKRKNKK